MKTLTKEITKALLAFLCLCLAFNCSDDDSGSNNDDNLRIKARATYEDASTSRTFNGNIAISEFKLNISEIELEFDDDYEDLNDDNEYDDDGVVDFDDDIEFLGPFELDILNNTATILSIDLPEGNYEELEFEFDKNTNPNSDLYNKTILVTGTIDGQSFEFWHDFEEDLELDYEDENNDITVDNGLSEIIISFNLNDLFNTSTGVDLSEATDNNGDGVIEISPTDSDGNNVLANQIKEAIKDVIDLLDD
ncbi:hypothetical protein [Winogradskyella flava]|uniref:hypothetical protein n=1 Tax=Winogradskyella flava TaxID=1884876 RepID=UPI0024937A1B|nr:hypothetical protein [Winogradskyella flava]